MKEFITFMCQRIQNRRVKPRLASDFLITFWRCLGISEKHDNKEKYVCCLKGKITNFPENGIQKLISIIQSPSLMYFSNEVQSVLDITNETVGHEGKLETILQDSSYTLFQIKTPSNDGNGKLDSPSLLNRILFRDGMERLDIPFTYDEELNNHMIDTLVSQESSIFVPSARGVIYWSLFNSGDDNLVPRFNFFGLCGFGNYRNDLEISSLDQYYNATSLYINSHEFKDITTLIFVTGNLRECELYLEYIEKTKNTEFQHPYPELMNLAPDITEAVFSTFLIPPMEFINAMIPRDRCYRSITSEKVVYPLRRQKDLLQAIMFNPHLTNITKLYMNDQQIGDVVMNGMSCCPHICNLTSISLSNNQITDSDVLTLFISSKALPNLVHINLRKNRLSFLSVIYICELKLLTKLEDVNLSSNYTHIIEQDWDSLVAKLPETVQSRSQTINKLELNYSQITNSGAASLVSSLLLKNLTSLSLESNFISDDGAISIANNCNLQNLRALYCKKNLIGDIGASAIATSIVLSNLKSLFLSENLITEEGWICFATCDNLSNLETLCLGIPEELQFLFAEKKNLRFIQ